MISTARSESDHPPLHDPLERDVKARVLAVEVEQLAPVRAEEFAGGRRPVLAHLRPRAANRKHAFADFFPPRGTTACSPAYTVGAGHT